MLPGERQRQPDLGTVDRAVGPRSLRVAEQLRQLRLLRALCLPGALQCIPDSEALCQRNLLLVLDLRTQGLLLAGVRHWARDGQQHAVLLVHCYTLQCNASLHVRRRRTLHGIMLLRQLLVKRAYLLHVQGVHPHLGGDAPAARALQSGKVNTVEGVHVRAVADLGAPLGVVGARCSRARGGGARPLGAEAGAFLRGGTAPHASCSVKVVLQGHPRGTVLQILSCTGCLLGTALVCARGCLCSCCLL
mmetsp:Transcript_1736/g.4283  ORF Transcript_1736/g.4283 Transcript_1736/m.4283 type:complete len:247 (-) Transcript_1736:1241-1981(-)